jgi:hypothetical protein
MFWLFINGMTAQNRHINDPPFYQNVKENQTALIAGSQKTIDSPVRFTKTTGG